MGAVCMMSSIITCIDNFSHMFSHQKLPYMIPTFSSSPTNIIIQFDYFLFGDMNARRRKEII